MYIIIIIIIRYMSNPYIYIILINSIIKYYSSKIRLILYLI